VFKDLQPEAWLNTGSCYGVQVWGCVEVEVAFSHFKSAGRYVCGGGFVFGVHQVHAAAALFPLQQLLPLPSELRHCVW
jgi:hypothetical protein